MEIEHTNRGFIFLLAEPLCFFQTFLVAIVVEIAFLDSMFEGPVLLGICSWVSIIAVIYVYTRQGGMATVIWTDTIQTACMLGAVVLTDTPLPKHRELPSKKSQLLSNLAD